VILITVQEKFRDNINDLVLTSAAEAALDSAELQDSPSLSIRITDDQEIRSLNNQYRGLDKATDVLSFPADFTDPDIDSRYLGDIVISFTRAEEQAVKRGHQVEEELQLLVVHGILHLLDYDHADPDEKDRMWTLQNRILSKLGLDIQVEE
jgi:probable rRNA maturation factor